MGCFFHSAYFSVYVWLASLCVVNSFHSTGLFPYLLKVLWCYQGVQKETRSMKWVNLLSYVDINWVGMDRTYNFSEWFCNIFLLTFWLVILLVTCTLISYQGKIKSQSKYINAKQDEVYQYLTLPSTDIQEVPNKWVI